MRPCRLLGDLPDFSSTNTRRVRETFKIHYLQILFVVLCKVGPALEADGKRRRRGKNDNGRGGNNGANNPSAAHSLIGKKICRLTPSPDFVQADGGVVGVQPPAATLLHYNNIIYDVFPPLFSRRADGPFDFTLKTRTTRTRSASFRSALRHK